MRDVAHETVLELEYPSEPVARIVARSVAREVGEIDDDRSATTVDRSGATVAFTVHARDLAALRAATNTWLRLAAVAEATAGLAEDTAAVPE